MNPLIKELAHTAASRTGANLMAQDPKFVAALAELIVAECATLIPAEQSHAPNGQPILKIFQEHFGVE